MTRIIQCGYETGDVAQAGSDTTGTQTGTVAVVTTTPTPRSGSYCLKCSLGSISTGAGVLANTARKTFVHASKTELWYAFGFQKRHLMDAQGVPGVCMFKTFDTAGNVNVMVFCDQGVVRAYYATAGGATPSSAQVTLIGAASAVVIGDLWYHVDIRIVAATGATGTFELWLNGERVINATSQRTCQTNANLGSFTLEINTPVVGFITSGVSGLYHAFDDLRVNDTAGSVNNSRAGDESIRLVKPEAAGDLTQLTRGGTDSGANWSQVDEIPPTGTTDYVYGSTSGLTDLYNCGTVSVAAVRAVQVIVQAYNADGGGGQIYLPTKTAAGQSDGTAQPIAATPSYYTRLLETDPADSGAWTQAKIDALQLGAKVV